MNKIMLIILTGMPFLTGAMDKRDPLDAAFEKVAKVKIEKYNQKLQARFEKITKAVDVAQSTKNGQCLAKLYKDEKYADVLEYFLKEGKLNPNFTWQENRSRMMCPITYTFNLLAAALEAKAIKNAKVLVKMGAEVNTVTSSFELSSDRSIRPLEEAVRLNNPDLVSTMLAEKKVILDNENVSADDFPLSIALSTFCTAADEQIKKDARTIITTLIKKGFCAYEKATELSFRPSYYYTSPLAIVRCFPSHFDEELMNLLDSNGELPQEVRARAQRKNT
jgi:hypothetical protein